MAAPTPTARATPSGIPLKDGYQTLITIASDTDISFWEKTVTPPGIEGGERVEQTTMHNTTWLTFRPQELADLTECTIVAAYDPDAYDEILAVLNVETTITVTFPDGSTLAFFGYLRTFTPSENARGSQPEATIVIGPTNWDSSNNVEAGPAMAEVEGT